MFTSALVNLYTSDIEASLRFYRDLLEFEETFRTPTEGTPAHVELALGGFVLGLGDVAAARTVHGTEPTPGAPALALVVWTEDVDAACSRLREAGVPLERDPTDQGNGNRAALVRDPDGTLVEVVARRT